MGPPQVNSVRSVLGGIVRRARSNGERRRGGVAAGIRSDSPVVVTTGRQLNTGYTDDDIVRMAGEDGAREFQTDTWGAANHEPRGLHEVGQAVTTGVESLGVEAWRATSEVDVGLEAHLASLPGEEADACEVLLDVEQATGDQEQLAGTIRREGLQLPRQGLLHAVPVLTVFFFLMWAETILLSRVFELFGLSDEPILDYLSELKIAGLSSAVALSVLMHVGGTYLCGLIHAATVRARDGGVKEASYVNRVRVVTVVSTVALLVVGLGAALYMQLGLTELRTAFFSTKGVDAHPAAFMALQVGIGAAGLLWALHHAHPYSREWDRATAHLAATLATARPIIERFVTSLQQQHGEVRARVLMLQEFCTLAEALLSEGTRQLSLYIRVLMHSLPEPTEFQLFDETLPAITRPKWIDVVTNHLSGVPAPGPVTGQLVAPVLKYYRECEPTAYVATLKAINERRAGQASTTGAQLAEFLKNLPQVPVTLNGSAHTKAP